MLIRRTRCTLLYIWNHAYCETAWRLPFLWWKHCQLCVCNIIKLHKGINGLNYTKAYFYPVNEFAFWEPMNMASEGTYPLRWNNTK